MKKIIFIMFYIVMQCGLVFAADYCVSPSGAGAKTGADWNNAIDWSALSTTGLSRGNTYYLADGSYIQKKIATAVSGTALITIKKATAAAHVTETGWVSTMGDGQSIFQWNGTPGLTSTIDIYTSYVVFDGVSGTGDSIDSYGFKIIPYPADCSSTIYLIGIPGVGHSSTTMSNVTVSHVAMPLCGYTDGLTVQVGLYSYPAAASNITVSNNYFAGGSANMQLRKWTDSTITGNYFNGNWSSTTNHGQQISPGQNSNDIVLSNNIFKDSQVFIVSTHKYDNWRWNIYNNIIIGGSHAGFSNGDSGTIDVVRQFRVHHNVFIGVAFAGQGAVFVGNLTNASVDRSYVYNNLFYNCSYPRLDNNTSPDENLIHDYNAYYSVTGTKTTETNWIVASGDPFVNAAGGDYHLATSITGTTLDSPFDVDYDGVTRTAFSQGAYEFTGAYPIGGTLSGLGTGLTVTLRNNGVDTTPISASGTYSMLTSMATDSTYEITISSQPTGQTCIVSNGTGTVASAAVTNVNVGCYWTVTASAGEGCNVTPEGESEVLGGASRIFVVNPSSGYGLTNVTGTCGGYVVGAAFYSNAITADCTVIANCSLLTPGPYGATMTVGSGSAFTMGSGNTFVVQ